MIVHYPKLPQIRNSNPTLTFKSIYTDDYYYCRTHLSCGKVKVMHFDGVDCKMEEERERIEKDEEETGQRKRQSVQRMGIFQAKIQDIICRILDYLLLNITLKFNRGVLSGDAATSTTSK